MEFQKYAFLLVPLPFLFLHRDIELNLTLRCEISSSCHAVNVAVILPLPKSTTGYERPSEIVCSHLFLYLSSTERRLKPGQSFVNDGKHNKPKMSNLIQLATTIKLTTLVKDHFLAVISSGQARG